MMATGGAGSVPAMPAWRNGRRSGLKIRSPKGMGVRVPRRADRLADPGGVATTGMAAEPRRRGSVPYAALIAGAHGRSRPCFPEIGL